MTLQIYSNPSVQKFGSIQANPMIDSGSVVSLMTTTLATTILGTTQSAKWITAKQNKDLKTISSEPITVLRKPATTVLCNDWTCKEASLTVVENGYELIIRRDLFSCLGMAVVQQQANSFKRVNNIGHSEFKIKESRVAYSQSSLKNLPLKDSCSKIAVSSRVHSKASKRSTRSNLSTT